MCVRTVKITPHIYGCLAVLIAVNAFAGDITPELQAELDRLDPSDEVAVIVRFTDPVNLRAFQNRSLGARRQIMLRALKSKAAAEQRNILPLLTRLGARDPRQLWLINAQSARVPVRAVKRIAHDRHVASVDLDRTIVLSGMPSSCSVSPAGWNLDTVHAADLWALGYDGAGVVVATMDSGVDPNHPDIGPNWRGGNNSWFDPNNEHLTPADANGHGTWALGLIVGGDTGGTAIGMAPGAQWISVKIFDDSGTAAMSVIHAGFQWLLDPDDNPATDDAPDIVNNSWVLAGTVNECDNEFQSDIDALRLADIAVVFAAGNSGPGSATSMSPASDPQSVAVGSVAEVFGTLFVTGGSARGPSACDGGVFPRLAAPGANVVTADLTAGGVFPDSYTCVSGTSFAAPHVSGAMALLKSAMNSQGQSVTASQLESALIAGATDMGESGPDSDWGAGLLHVPDAYDWLLDAHAGSSFPSQIDFGSVEYTAPEHLGDILVTVGRTGGSAGDVKVDFSTVDAGATAGDDYAGVAGTLTFLDGQTSQSFLVSIVDDPNQETDEQLSLVLSNPTGGAKLGSLSNSKISIVDNDSAPGSIDANANDYIEDVYCNDNNSIVCPGALENNRDLVRPGPQRTQTKRIENNQK